MSHAAFGEGGAGAKRGSGPGSEVESVVGEIVLHAEEAIVATRAG